MINCRLTQKAIADSLVKKENQFSTYRSNYTDVPDDKDFNLPNKFLGFTKQTARYKVTFQIDNISFNYTGSKNVEIYSVEGFYLISILK